MLGLNESVKTEKTDMNYFPISHKMAVFSQKMVKLTYYLGEDNKILFVSVTFQSNALLAIIPKYGFPIKE